MIGVGLEMDEQTDLDKLRERLAAVRERLVINRVWRSPVKIVEYLAQVGQMPHEDALAFIGSMVDRGLIRHSEYDGKFVYEPAFHTEVSIKSIPLNADSDELDLYEEHILPVIKHLPKNILGMCEYGVTEMINNVIDHSESPTLSLAVRLADNILQIHIMDDGIGIFEKIMRDFNLESEPYAIELLVKGKVTSDPENHSGEGIFFTSRAFDRFSIVSRGYGYTVDAGKEFTMALKMEDDVIGSGIALETPLDTKQTMNDVYKLGKTNNEGESRFDSTRIPLTLSVSASGMLVSRSQAKRILSGLDKFNQAVIDFADIESVGRSFIDEIFRIFRLRHPGVHLVTINANDEIKSLIDAALHTNE